MTAIWLLLVLVLTSGSSQARTLWVATNGNNANPCTDSPPSSPLSTGAKASVINVVNTCNLGAGDTVIIRGGTYTERWRTTDWTGNHSGAQGNPLTFKNHATEAVTFVLDGRATMQISTNPHDLTVEGIHFTCTNCSTQVVCSLDGNLVGTQQHILGGTRNTLRNVELSGASSSGLELRGTGHVLQGGSIHDIGYSAFDHGIYADPLHNSIIDGVTFYNTQGSSIKTGQSAGSTNNIIRNNVLRDFGLDTGKQKCSPPDCVPPNCSLGVMQSGGGSGYTAADGTADTKFYNNVIYACRGPAAGGGDNLSGAIQTFTTTNTEFYNNTIDMLGSPCVAIETQAEGSGLIFKNNLIRKGSVASILNSAAGTVFDQNLCTASGTGCEITATPTFQNAGQGDYRLTQTSRGVNEGVSVASVFTTDKFGTPRPQPDGGAWDIGMHEFVGEAPPEPDPIGNVAWYPFDNSGTDASGLGHTLSPNGQAAFVAPGAIGTHATTLDGTGDYWSTTMTTALKPPTKVSLNAWIKCAGTDTAGAIVVSGGDSYTLEVLLNGNVFGSFYDGTTWQSLASTGINLCDQAWHMVTFVKSSTQLFLYSDAVLRNSLTHAGTISYTLGSNLFVGHSFASPTDYDFNGQIDQVRVYDDELSQIAVSNLFNERVPQAGFTVTHCTYTLADAVLGFPRGSIDTDIANAFSTPIGLQCSVQYTGSPPSPAAETFKWFCNVNGGAFTALTNSHGSLGVRVHTDLGVDMGQTIPAASGLLPLDGFTAIDGVVTADTLASAPLAMLTGQQAALEVRIDVGAPADDNDTIQCRPHRQDGSVMTYRAGAIRTMQLLPDARGVVRSGNRIQGGKNQ